MKKPLQLVALALLSTILFRASTAGGEPAPKEKPLLVAHRGASAYAPEHTLAAYRLAIEQGADFVEQDLQMTRDGRLICAHDAELSRTTDAAEVFPDRATSRDPDGSGTPRRGWYAIDFTLEEIKRLDAGSWFNRANAFAARDAYKGQRVPTLEEAIKAIANRAGLYIEIKHYEFYKSHGKDMVAALAAALKAAGYDEADRREKVFIQSFSKACLLRMREVAPGYARVQLLPMDDAGRREETSRVTPALAREVAGYARGAGPSKQMITGRESIETFHSAGLVVHPYTFRGSTTAVLRRPLDERQPNGSTLRESIITDINRFIDYGVDGGFTDYPDLWREALKRRSN
ncbi:MAG TPA: glycerophosphodiester phosphodiesterase family protein [Blastocatellia bacterium]|nr:glycerophosphodiester phosphodiesterase family protein [Blastocatellia bacterium]